MNIKILNGIIIDEQTELSLSEICTACSSSAEWIIELVEEGALDPIGSQQNQWRFTGKCLLKARTAMRLQRDLGLNLAGIALALDLLDKIESLESRLSQFE
ncbi:MAG: chaperone modulator CbpM [Gammaproteobacteria bacterium]|nr:chaperone modulator CbpM [Gammaproteobacteria bacterium]MCW8986570.1 chaperone modulator CbpM [Gammaproteobacteria bacterium]MCW9031979.1 chaperone modulator CbpM [Gammaproteobacteria bacterium]